MIIKTAPPPAAVPTMIMGSGVEVCKEEVHPCVGSQVETEVLVIDPGAVPVSVAVGVMVILMVYLESGNCCLHCGVACWRTCMKAGCDHTGVVPGTTA